MFKLQLSTFMQGEYLKIYIASIVTNIPEERLEEKVIFYQEDKARKFIYGH